MCSFIMLVNLASGRQSPRDGVFLWLIENTVPLAQAFIFLGKAEVLRKNDVKMDFVGSTLGKKKLVTNHKKNNILAVDIVKSFQRAHPWQHNIAWGPSN